ncbi:hypothetical protein Bbelb_201720 [Branchiostoma belcheri]|nr:hypothetical protein Bbelb_201720 [Branchiostoma belcheri]
MALQSYNGKQIPARRSRGLVALFQCKNVTQFVSKNSRSARITAAVFHQLIRTSPASSPERPVRLCQGPRASADNAAVDGTRHSCPESRPTTFLCEHSSPVPGTHVRVNNIYKMASLTYK